VVVCAAGPANEIDKLIHLAHSDGWQVNVVATPSAVAFLDVPAIHRLSGNDVRSDYAAAGQPRSHSAAADALIIAPATYNTVNKLALGVNDTYALNVAAEAIGRHTPTAVLPFVNQALARRRPFEQAIRMLREEGVAVMYGPSEWLPHPPGEGGQHVAAFPWEKPLAAVTKLL